MEFKLIEDLMRILVALPADFQGCFWYFNEQLQDLPPEVGGGGWCLFFSGGMRVQEFSEKLDHSKGQDPPKITDPKGSAIQKELEISKGQHRTISKKRSK